MTTNKWVVTSPTDKIYNRVVGFQYSDWTWSRYFQSHSNLNSFSHLHKTYFGWTQGFALRVIALIILITQIERLCWSPFSQWPRLFSHVWVILSRDDKLGNTFTLRHVMWWMYRFSIVFNSFPSLMVVVQYGKVLFNIQTNWRNGSLYTHVTAAYAPGPFFRSSSLKRPSAGEPFFLNSAQHF